MNQNGFPCLSESQFSAEGCTFRLNCETLMSRPGYEDSWRLLPIKRILFKQRFEIEGRCRRSALFLRFMRLLHLVAMSSSISRGSNEQLYGKCVVCYQVLREDVARNGSIKDNDGVSNLASGDIEV